MIDILQSLKIKNAESILLEILEDQDELVVFKAISTLGKIGGKKVIPKIKNAKEKIGDDLLYCVDDAINEILSRG